MVIDSSSVYGYLSGEIVEGKMEGMPLHLLKSDLVDEDMRLVLEGQPVVDVYRA